MKQPDPKTFDTAFVPPGTPMLSDVILRLEDNPELFETRTRDMISGLRGVARALGLPPEEVPADPRWLQPRLKKVEPAALGLTQKTWSNIRSNARAALAHYGIVDRRIRRKSDLDAEWQRLWTLMLAVGNPSLHAALCRFVHFLNSQGVNPTEVTDVHAIAYRDALEANEISKSPDGTYRAAVRGWNRAVALLQDWPQFTLSVPSRQKRVKMPDDTFPDSLHADLDRLTEKLIQPDPFDEGHRSEPVRPTTAVQYRRRLLCFASELVRSGVAAETIVDIATICAPEVMERGLRRMLAQNGNKTSAVIAQTAGVLRNVSRNYCGAAEEVQEQVSKLAWRVSQKPQTGMTQKNRTRLRPLQDPATMKSLLHLPDRLFNAAKAGRKPHYRALDREVAVAMAILQVCPVRVKNLSEIHLERNLQRQADGRVFLVFEGEEVKNERPLEFDLPQDLIRMIDRHLATRVPELCPSGTPWLFPRRDGQGPIGRENMSTRITRTIRKSTGLDVNAHLFRHLAVMLWLDANPGSYEAARRLLGHSSISHTLNLYAGMEARSATRAFSDLVSAKKEARR